MIRIDRGDVPDHLDLIAWFCVSDAEEALKRGQRPIFKGYQSARSPLYRAQHGKCATCEMQCLETQNPTEHFRPKAKVTSDPNYVTSPVGYWWLAWNWDNLLFSCTTCNSQARKGNHFALEPGSTPLSPRQEPPGDEQSMFIDPSCEDPLDHIVFVQLRRGHWVPRPYKGSSRGHYTVAKLGLDRPDLLTLYRDHVEHTVQPRLQQIRSALPTEDPRKISTAWHRCLRMLFHPRARFHALSYDVLNAAISAEARQRWRLSLPRP